MTHGKHCDKHDHCDHCLHYCGTCDKPYCCKCGREWPARDYLIRSQWNTWTPYLPATCPQTTWPVGNDRGLYATCTDHAHTPHDE
jgi:hypothetical protein